MKKAILLKIIITILASLIILVFYIIRINQEDRNKYDAQANLAQELGVQISDYPYQTTFPLGYYYSILQPGLTIVETHNKIIGFRKVLMCSGNSEIYYFLDTEEDAIRFRIVYNEYGILERFEGEEPDSRTLSVEGCVQGQLSDETP